MAEGQPTLFPNGTIDETVPYRTWEQSDMDLALYTFRDWDCELGEDGGGEREAVRHGPRALHLPRLGL